MFWLLSEKSFKPLTTVNKCDKCLTLWVNSIELKGLGKFRLGQNFFTQNRNRGEIPFIQLRFSGQITFINHL